MLMSWDYNVMQACKLAFGIHETCQSADPMQHTTHVEQAYEINGGHRSNTSRVKQSKVYEV